MPSSTPLRIAVLGVGNIGSSFAVQLAQTGGHDVTVIARPGSARLQQLLRDKGILTIDGERADVRVLDRLDEETPYDLVIVTVLAHQADSVLAALQRSAAKAVLFMCNTFDPERLRDRVGADRCAFGMPFIQAFLREDGKLTARIGAGGQKTKLSDQRWVDLFNAAGLPAMIEPNMLLWLRCHVPLCIAFESAAVAGVRRGGGASWGEAMAIARGVQESFHLIKGLGFALYPAGKSRLSKCPTWLVAGLLWLVTRVTSFRDLLALGLDECRALVDVLVAAAPQATLPVTVPKIEAMKPVTRAAAGTAR